MANETNNKITISMIVVAWPSLAHFHFAGEVNAKKRAPIKRCTGVEVLRSNERGSGGGGGEKRAANGRKTAKNNENDFGVFRGRAHRTARRTKATFLRLLK